MSDDPLWISIPATDPLTATAHGKHQIEFVSRHAIAETGLLCPVCRTELAALGDYTMVRHSRLGDVIKCNGKRVVQDEEFPCGMYLVASPDTEHGDHLIYDKVPADERHALFHSFVRVSEGDAARRKYGEDISLRDGELVTAASVTVEQVSERPRLTLAKDQVWQTDDGRQVTILRVQNDGDPMFDGWAWGTFLNEPAFEWNIDPTGLIRQSMRDPTLNDRVRLTSEVRPL